MSWETRSDHKISKYPSKKLQKITPRINIEFRNILSAKCSYANRKVRWCIINERVEENKMHLVKKGVPRIASGTRQGNVKIPRTSVIGGLGGIGFKTKWKGFYESESLHTSPPDRLEWHEVQRSCYANAKKRMQVVSDWLVFTSIYKYICTYSRYTRSVVPRVIISIPQGEVWHRLHLGIPPNQDLTSRK